MLDFINVQEKIDDGNALLNNVEALKINGKPLPGSSKLANRIKSEIRFLSKVAERKIPFKPCHMTSTNLGSLKAVLNVVTELGCDNVSAVLNSFKDTSRKNALCVDIVANNGLLWVKVIARNAAALHTLWKGQGQFGERSLISAARDFLDTAQCHPIDYLTPKILFYFANGVPVGLASELVDMGILVDGDVVFCPNEDSDSDNELNDTSNSTKRVVSTSKLTEVLSQNLSLAGCAVEISKVNLDISSMLTLISNLSNGFDHHIYGLPVLDEQAKQERKSKVLPKLEAFLEKKALITSRTALKHFNDIVTTIGGPKEKERAELLLSKLTVVDDDPSSRTRKLASSSKLNERAKIIFGTGDSHQAVTVTANVGFVRAALQSGVRFSVFEHEPRALTESKEKKAKNDKIT